MQIKNRRKRQLGTTQQNGKRLRSLAGQPLFKASVKDYMEMKQPKPGVYGTRSEGNKHIYVLFDRRKPRNKRKELGK